jgi:hypothetical protein
MLLMATPYADTAHAYNVVVTAGSANDSSTPDQRPGHGLHGAMDAPQAPIALQRWESDGGAVQ